MHDHDSYRESREAELGYSEVSARELRLRDWEITRVDRDFQKLVWRLQAKKYWAAKAPERKARIKAYRAQWQRDHRERMNELQRARRKKNGRVYSAKELATRKANRAAEKLARHAAAVWTCEVCGAQWCTPLHLGLPRFTPKWCSTAHKSRAATERRIAAGKCLHCSAPARPGKRTCFECRSYPARRAGGGQE